MPFGRKPVPFLLALLAVAPAAANPHAQQAAEQIALLASPSATTRASAAEALGFLRAKQAPPTLAEHLTDDSPEVRRSAAAALAWCGGRDSIPPLLRSLNDADWSVRQSAWVALTNLTGMDLPFEALAMPEVRGVQVAKWKAWWASVPDDEVPAEVRALLAGPTNLARGCKVAASTTYKGPPTVLTDGKRGPEYWQTKEVPFPQSCTIDLGKPTEIAGVLVVHYAARFATTDYELATSVDGKSFQPVHRRKVKPLDELHVRFEPRAARYVRLTSFASANPTYPTTFFEVEVYPRSNRERLRAIRALGYLGGEGATKLILSALGPLKANRASLAAEQRDLLRTGLESLGRLRDPAALTWLLDLLWDTYWARYTAEALGELGDDRAIPMLLAALPRYSRDLRRQDPVEIPPDDRTGLSHVDRMYETTFAILSALSRLPFDDERNVAALREAIPLLLANLPEDFDGAVLYEREAHHRIIGHLLDVTELRQATCEAAFEALGQPRLVPPPLDTPALPMSSPAQHATWLSAFCQDTRDVPRLVALLDHKDGWVRINAAKALAYLGDARAAKPLAKHLAAAKPEGAYGFSPNFLDEEFADPTPRWREALVRGLGRLKATEHVELIARVMHDAQSAVGIRVAAAKALAALGSDEAKTELAKAAATNPFLSVRQVAREALWRRGRELPRFADASFAGDMHPQHNSSPEMSPAQNRGTHVPGEARWGYTSPTNEANAPGALVFIKGDNVLTHLFQTDPWRQSYITSDSGPAHRPGRNLFVLRPPTPDGKVTPLTQFKDGWVADCEVSWDGTRVLFSRREESDPWWHLFEINADGTGLRQLTDGPFHDVGPCYLPDGRIVFASSRVGMRDEYHGYPATSLHVCDPDGGNLRHLLVNTNRDNEPAVLPNGHLVFSRLEVFYSRLKTELTLHACLPDGTRDVVLYGPERRAFWGKQPPKPHKLDFFGWVKPMHRVLRLTQPQGMPDGTIICSTPGGLTLVGRNRDTERIIPHDGTRAFTTPFPLPNGRVLCASTLKAAKQEDADLGLYWIDPETGMLTLVYNDPEAADYEARPLMPRPLPPTLAENHNERAFTGTFTCLSVRNTREPGVAEHGRFLRVIEGLPVTARHSTQTNRGEVWQNHHGTIARVLGTVPLAPDGSFSIEVPADRLLQLQVLDSDRQVLGNVLTWLTARPGEKRTCIGCHERPNTTPLQRRVPQATNLPPFKCLPTGNEFRYRAKLWQKGTLLPEAERRLRTVRAINLHAKAP